MRTFICCLVFALCAIARADTPPAVKEQLRKLSRLPTVRLQLAFNINSIEGLMAADEDVDPETEIATLRKAMTGSSEDARRWFQLSKLLWRVEPGSKPATEALDKSIELYRKRIEAQPGNGLVLAEFGEALAAANRDEEAEKMLRDAVRAAPTAWQTWLSLAGHLQSKANAMVRAGEQGKNQQPAASLAAGNKPSAEQVERAQRLMKEAMDCYDKAVAAGPDEAKVYERRGVGRCDFSAFEAIVRFARGGEKDTSKIAVAFLDPQGLADFRKAVELNPRNYRAISAGITLEVMAAKNQVGGAPSPGGLWEAMPEESKTAIRDGMTKLQKLGEDPDRKVAAAALEQEGALRFVILQDVARSEEKLRRAIALDPTRAKSWGILTALLAISGQSQQLAELCEQRVKVKDNADNRYLVAKAREKLGQFEQAEKELRAALKSNPDHINSLGGMAALLLKHADNDSLRQAAMNLKHAEDMVSKIAPDKQNDDQKNDLIFTHALYNALTGQTESSRQLLRGILERDKDYEGAQTALEALERQQ